MLENVVREGSMRFEPLRTRVKELFIPCYLCEAAVC